MMAAVSILFLIATIIGLVIRDRMVARRRGRPGRPSAREPAEE